MAEMAVSGAGRRKRRRERDRPKAGPDAAYNPNKRVLLSYASDDGEEDGLELEQPAGTGHPQAVDAVTSNYEIPPYRDDAEPSSDENEQPAAQDSGLANDPSDEAGEDADAVKQTRKNDGSLWSRGVMKNTETGQWPALGSLSYQWDEDHEGDESDYDSATEEAMAYLRGVRSERQSMPAFFSAPAETQHADLYESGVGDGRGYVSEGTYIGRPDVIAPVLASTETMVAPQEAYTKALKQRFLRQRQQMHITPDPASIAALDEAHPTTFSESARAYEMWHDLFQSAVPLPAQLCAMDTDTARRHLVHIRQTLLVRCREIKTNTSAWIWSLLARLDDVGTMNNEEASAVRDLGKRAILVQLSFYDPAAAQQLEEMDAESAADANNCENQASEHTADEAGVSREDTGTTILSSASTGTSARQNTLITLDMIIAIVGEVFGQRDLLEFRREWTMQEGVAHHDVG